MKVSNLLLVFVFLSLSAYFCASQSAPVPFFVWSNNDFFLGQNQILSEMSSSNAQSLLQSCCFVKNSTASSFSRYFKKDVNSIPEVVILFLEQKMSTEQFAELSSVYHRKPNTNSQFSNLANEIENAKSNLLVPLVRVDHTNQKISDILSEIFVSSKTLFPSSSSLLVKSQSSSFLSNLVDKITTNTPEQFIDYLNQKESKIFSNGVPDLVIIPFDSPTFYDHDAYMEKVQKIVDEKTNGNFISIYTADSPKPSHALRSFTVEQMNTISAVSEVSQASLYSSNSDPYNVGVYTSYFPIQVFEIIMVAIFTIGTILVGGLCLFGTQTPQRYETPKKQKSELM